MDKIRVIKGSLLCFNLGWFGLVPLLGIVPAVLAIQYYGKVSREVQAGWNPARKFAVTGVVVAYVGLLEALVCWAGLMYLILRFIFLG